MRYSDNNILIEAGSRGNLNSEENKSKAIKCKKHLIILLSGR
jgi:hypothetical protein